MPNSLKRPTIKELPALERPRERFVRYGPSALSHAELLAILIRTGTARSSARDLAESILLRTDGLKGLASVDIAEMAGIRGMGETKSVQVLAAVELGRRMFALENEDLPIIRSPKDAVGIFMSSLRFEERERFMVAHLNTKNQMLAVETISIGTLNASLVHPRELFKTAVRRSSASLILAHNHPSGDPKPSTEDIQLTRRLQQAGELMGIEVLDHLIIGGDQFISLKEKGFMS